MLTKLKEEILKNADFVTAAPYASRANGIRYIDFSKTITDMQQTAGEVVNLSNVYEADITAAYYRAALNLNFISQATYTKCLGLPKSERLRLMGSIATRKVNETYKDGALLHSREKKNELLREAWFKICSYVDCAMQKLKTALGELFLFYWVDGIYFYYGKEARLVKKPEEFWRKTLHDQYHFDWKIIPLEKFEIKNCGNYCEIALTKPGAKKPKYFYPKKEVIRGYFLQSESDFLIDMPHEKAQAEFLRRLNAQKRHFSLNL